MVQNRRTITKKSRSTIKTPVIENYTLIFLVGPWFTELSGTAAHLALGKRFGIETIN